MLYDLALGVLSIGMVVGGLYMIQAPARFIIRANPSLQLLDEHLPEGWTERIVQGFGGMLMLFFTAYLYVRYVT